MNIIDWFLTYLLQQAQCDGFYRVKKSRVTVCCIRPRSHPGACRDHAGGYFISEPLK